MHSPHVRSKSYSPLQGQNIYVNYLEFFCLGDLSLLSHLLCYSIIYLHCGHLFYTLSYSATLHFNFILWLKLWPLGIRNSFIWLLCPFDMPPFLWVFVVVIVCFFLFSFLTFFIIFWYYKIF